MGDILTGTASWTDPTLLATDWYPDSAASAEDRLKFYASNFPLVEVDSTFYSPPAERSAILWADRTPDHFTFDFKAFRLFTGHPTPVKTLPKVLRQSLADELTGKDRVYSKDLPGEVVTELWDMYRRALMPVHSAGKLGAVFLQYPKWFFFGRDSMDAILRAKENLPDFPVAVEFRQSSWLSEKNAEKTLRFLSDHDLAFTCVDEPQGTTASVPPVAVATAKLSVVRFHGRRTETWDKPGVGVEERFKYLYSEEELREWVPKVQSLARETDQVHVLMNNCYADYGVRNAHQLSLLLEDAGTPVGPAT